MKVKFDSLNRFEVPDFLLCNPGCVYKDGTLTNVIGCLSNTTDEELIMNFNTTSELNFRIYLVDREDPDERTYVKNIYNSIKNRRLIFIEDIGFFVITNVKVGYDSGVHYKDVQAESCEYELGNRVMPYIEDGTYKFIDLLEQIVSSLPIWKIGDVNGDIAEKYRTFEDVNSDQNVLSFLLEDIQDAYECIIECDCVNRIIHVYDQNAYVRQTQVHLTKNDLINSIEITEDSDDLYTAISVQGDDNLNISPVNPLGTNVMYNFNYYLDWMTPSLKNKVELWQNLVRSKETDYYDLNLQYYDLLTEESDLQAELDRLNTQLDMYQRCRDNIVAEGTTATVESYNEIIVKNGGVPVGIQQELSDTINSIDDLMDDVKAQINSVNRSITTVTSEKKYIDEDIIAIHNAVDILTYFTEAEYEELCNYIYEGSYSDEYITVTSSMTYSEKFEQMRTLYDRAVARLERISEPTQEFSLDVENFIFAKEFEQWSAELETGCLINVELDTNDIAALFLSNMTVNYDDKTLKMTFGNRFNRFDPQAIFKDALGDIKKSANSIGYIKEILYPVKNGEFSAMQEAIESSGILTKNEALSSTNQEIIIDDTGILGRKMLDTGEYDDRQIKVTNQSIVFTNDGWDTASTALGNFKFNNPFTGEVEDRYGVIADMLVGSVVLSEEVGVYNAENSITLDGNGFTLTSDYTKPNPIAKVFTIQKKVLDDSGEEQYLKQMYLDSNGNLVLNGTLSVHTSSNGSVNLEDISGGVSMDDVTGAINRESESIYNEMNNKYSEISNQTNAQINNAIKTESESLKSSIEGKYDSVMSEIEDQLSSHKAEVGQYMTFNESGLTLGAASSDFKTVIDNSGMYFNQGNTIVSYVNNNQLYIPNAVIESTLILGSFFFSPRDDGGFSLIWQDKN